LITALLCGCGGSSESVKNASKSKNSDGGIELLGEEEETGVTRDVDFMAEDGVIVRGTFHPSPKREGSSEKGDSAVLLVHQLGSNRTEWLEIVPKLQQTHSVLSIDLRGHGESLYRNDGKTIDRESFTEDDWAQTVLDVRAAVVYLRDLQPPPTTVTLIGSSIGSSAVLLYAASDPKIDSLVLLSPGLSYRGMATLPAMKALDGRPVLLLATEGDRESASAARELAEQDPHASSRVFEGEGHGVTMSGPLVPAVVEFVKATPAPPRP
jgi:pimeloyl-ACP methyl ester carboxylesterase